MTFTKKQQIVYKLSGKNIYNSVFDQNIQSKKYIKLDSDMNKTSFCKDMYNYGILRNGINLPKKPSITLETLNAKFRFVTIIYEVNS